MRSTSTIRESTVGSSTEPLRVDRDAGVIHDVVVLRGSGNFDYPKSTREAAIPLLEGKRVFVDHGPPSGRRVERSYRDALGVVQGVYERGDGLYAREFHFNPRHPLAEQLCWDAEHAPHLLGFSVVGDAGGKRKVKGRTVVESIARLDSCDLVTTPAHGGGIFESERHTMTIREIIERLEATRPGYARGLREAMDAASGVLTDDAAMDMPAEDPAPEESADHEQALKDGFRAAILAALDDDGMDAKEKLEKIGEILKTEERMLEKGGGDDTPADDTAAEESRKLETQTLREVARLGVTLTPILERAIAGCRTRAEAKELIESIKGEKPRPGARSGAPTREHSAAVRESAAAATAAKQQADTPEERQRRVAAARRQR